MAKDTSFYNQESIQYSEKRYPSVVQSYTQFFFTRRLAITKDFIRHFLSQGIQHPKLLEVGCADGIVMREIEKTFPRGFAKLTGIDTAREMIGEAQRRNTSARAEYLERSHYSSREPVDIIVETGVVNYANFDEESAFVAEHLKSGGQYLFSIAGTGSLHNRLKPEGDFKDFRPYAEYDRLIRKSFTVLSVRGCGFFIPYLWRVPALARVFHGVIDPLAGLLLPGLCHEKVYLVKKK